MTLAIMAGSDTTAFAPRHRSLCYKRPLFMGKGFHSARNKQAELAKKMELAKKQRQGDSVDPGGDEKDEERRQKEEERAMFDKLLTEKAFTRAQGMEDMSSEKRAFPPQQKKKKKKQPKPRDVKQRRKDSIAQENAKKKSMYTFSEAIKLQKMCSPLTFVLTQN